MHLVQIPAPSSARCDIEHSSSATCPMLAEHPLPAKQDGNEQHVVLLVLSLIVLELGRRQASWAAGVRSEFAPFGCRMIYRLSAALVFPSDNNLSHN